MDVCFKKCLLTCLISLGLIIFIYEINKFIVTSCTCKLKPQLNHIVKFCINYHVCATFYICSNHHRILWPRTIFIMNCKFLFPLNLAQRIIPFQSMFIVVQYVHVLVFKQSQTWSPFIISIPPSPLPKSAFNFNVHNLELEMEGSGKIIPMQAS